MDVAVRANASSGDGGRIYLGSWVALWFRSCWVCGLYLALWLIVVMWVSNFSVAFVCSSFVFHMLVCCPLGTGTLDFLLRLI